jgi:hypothetical protein
MACALCAIPLWAFAGVPTGPADLLRADFDSKTLGQPIGTGAAAAGEPSEILALDTEIVVCASARTLAGSIDKCLEVTNDLSATTARPIRWQLLDNAEITTGIVSISFDFIPSARDQYSLAVRESGGSANSFLTLTLNSVGSFTATDANGLITLNSFSYSAGQLLKIRFDFDLDAGTSQASINGTALFSGRAHGIVGRGVGRLNTGFGSFSAGNLFRLNNVVVQTPQALPVVLDANFNGQPVGQPLAAGGASANQPVLIDSGIAAQIIAAGAGNRALSLSLPTAQMASRTLRWEFLDNIEIVPGIVAIETDVEFASLNSYQFLVREVGGSASSYASLRFTPSGQLSVSDASGSGGIPGASYQAGIRYRLRLTFDQTTGEYSAMLNDTVLFEDRAHGVSTGRGIGAFLMGFSSNATAGAAMIIDDLQVGASAAADIASELAILQQPTAGSVGQALAPTLEIGALNVFDQLVTDGALVTIDAASGPAGGTFSQNAAATETGVARFPNLAANAAGVFQLRARADRSQVESAMPLTVAAQPVNLFRDGFEGNPN